MSSKKKTTNAGDIADDLSDFGSDDGGDGADNNKLHSYYMSRVGADGKTSGPQPTAEEIEHARKLEKREKAKYKVLKREVVRLRKSEAEMKEKLDAERNGHDGREKEYNSSLMKVAGEKNHLSNLLFQQKTHVEDVLAENADLRARLDELENEHSLIQQSLLEYFARDDVAVDARPASGLHDQVLELLSMLLQQVEQLKDQNALVKQDRMLMARQIQGYEAALRASQAADLDDREERLKALALQAMTEHDASHAQETGPLYDIPSRNSSPVDDSKENAARGKEDVPTEDIMYENQRKIPLFGWRSPALPTDRGRFSNKSGTVKFESLDSLPLPSSWRWVGNWRVSLDGNVDRQG